MFKLFIISSVTLSLLTFADGLLFMLAPVTPVNILQYTIFHTAFYNHSSVVYTKIIVVFLESCLNSFERVAVKPFALGSRLLRLGPALVISLKLVALHFFYL